MLKRYLFILAVISFGIMIFMSCSGDSVTTNPTSDPEIDLIFPNGGDTLQAGVPYTIKWSDNITEKVNIGIYRGLSSSAILIEEYRNVGGTEYQFTVPVNWSQTADYKVKITSAADTSVYDISDDYFRVSAYISDGNDQPSLATDLTIPHKGDYAIYGTGDVDWYRVYLYSQQRYHFTNTSEFDFDSEFYLYRGNTAGTDILFQVASDDDSGGEAQPYLDYTAQEEGYYFLRVAYYSNNPSKTKQAGAGYYTLNITEHIFLESPDGGDVWMKGTQHNITWDAEVPGNVDLSLIYEDGYMSHIATVSAASGTYTWTVSSGIDDAANYRIRIARSDNPGSFDESDEIFMICSNLTEYAVGDWDVYFEVMKWDISFELNNDGTGLWDGSWNGHWTLTGNGLKFTIDSYPNNFFLAIVDGDRFAGNFYDAGNRGIWSGMREIEVTNPDGGEVYGQGEICEITWEEDLSAEYVKIDLYKADVFDRTLFSNAVNDNFQSWTIPTNLPAAADYKIKISSTSDPQIYDESDDCFIIDLRTFSEFSEDFSDGIADGWRVVDGIWSVADGNYNVSYESLEASSCYYNRMFTENYSVETRLNQTDSYMSGIFVNGDHSDLNYQGLWEDYIGLFIQSSGYYYLERCDSGSYAGTGWLYSSEIVQGDGSWNDIRLDVNNSTGDYDIYINGTYITSINHTTFNHGEIGLMQYNSNTARTASFDRVSVGQIPVSKDLIRKYIELRSGERSVR
ncbi:MAG: pre-peptidase C-terminal domain-containing protein [Candidatus Delongbacteria bacterium]|nr:pre-peptidase C-terminal domain-containing protein [Candidatus Delongbacteria bacterium]